MKIKNVLTAFILLFSLLVLSGAALAQDYVVSEVEVDGVDAEEGIVFVERGQDLPVRVEIRGTGTDVVDNVRVRAWIGGYEHGVLEDMTKSITVYPGVIEVAKLLLEVPDDVEAGETYTLHVEIFDSQNSLEEIFDLRVEEKRHDLQIRTIVRGDESLEAGEPFFVSVRLDNNGDKDEEDLEVRIELIGNGIRIRAVGFVDELEKDDSTTHDELFLRIPEDAETGDYDLLTTVTYNDGHDQVTSIDRVHVEGKEQVTVTDGIGLQADSVMKSVAQGKGAVYVLSFVNSGTQARTFSAQVIGSESWTSEARVDPSFVTVQPDDVGELVVFVAASENAELGRKQFTVKVMSNSQPAGEISLGADIVQGDKVSGYNLESGLLVGFIVLVVILVILGIIVAFQKVGKEEGEEPEEPAPTPQTYY